MKEVEHIKIEKGMKVDELVKKMRDSGVMGGGKVGKAVDIIEEMVKDKCTVYLGVAGALVPGGMREILIDMLDYVDVFVCTGATLTHDLIEALGNRHYQGSERVDDKELRKKGIDRMFDSFMKNEVYQDLEKFFDENFDELKNEENIKDFLWKLGSLVKEDSILKKCYEKKIPVFCPGIADSGIGLMIWGKIVNNEECKVKAFDDLKEIMDIAMVSKKNGIIYLGGGVPKNYIQQALQFGKEASYGVQVTMDRPEPGGSSGAELREGISWGKMEEKAKFVDVICDVTIALPLIFGGLKDRLE